MQLSRFKTEYKKLHPNQKRAVDHIYGPLMILAGPGTGKTHVLTMRIANILLKADTQPSQILAITFTDAAAKEMRKRLLDLIGSSALQVKISTFHGFCNEVLETYPEYASLPMGSRPIEELEQLQIFEKLVDDLPLKLLKPYGNHHYFVSHIRSRIQRLKQEAITPGKFVLFLKKESKKCRGEKRVHASGTHKGKERADVLAKEHLLRKNEELARVYTAYEAYMLREKLYDFSDMLLATVLAIKKHKTLARILRERYEFILIDEHQDTNNAQQELIELLVHGISEPNVGVVGDEKQAIYRFQGGSMENFLYFKKKFPSAKILALDRNFRSQQKILDAVHTLGTVISPRSSRLTGTESPSPKTSVCTQNVRVCECASVKSELEFVAQDIQQKINQGISPQDIAILYRDNKDAHEIHEILENFDIAHAFETEQNIFLDPNVRNLLKIISAVADIGDEKKIIEALHVGCFGIKPHTLYSWMVELSAHKRKSIFSLDQKAVHELQLLAKEDANNNLTKTIERICIQTGFWGDFFGKENYYASLRNIQTLFDLAKDIELKKPNATCADLLEFVERAQKHGIQLRQKIDDTRPEGVRCMTAHRAKGREFEHVYILHAYDGHWGNRSIRDPLPLLDDVFLRLYKKGSSDKTGVPKKTVEEDEMRLLYVACTRAKNFLTISYPRVSFSGRQTAPTHFLDMLDARHISFISGDGCKKGIRRPKSVLSAKPNIATEEKELFFSLLQSRGLSVTGVNNFYDCVWKYIYVNLLRIPKTKEKWEQFGTVVHAALRDFFTAYAKKKTTKKFLLDRFEHHLEKEHLNEKVHQELLKKGILSLSSYYESHPNGWHKKYLLEYDLNNIDAGFSVALNGKLDKIELIDQKNVRVLDYKTGNPKSRNEIEGKTKNSTGDIKRQLVFYKLLLDSISQPTTHISQPTTHYSMKEGVIEFIEPDASGKNRTEIFTIEDEDRKKLKKEIKDMVRAFKDGSYESFACHKKDCDYCSLRNSITNTSSLQT